MREQLQRIRRGELQLFLPLIEQSIGHVYAAAKRDLPAESVESAVQNVYLKLYNDIATRYRFQNAERFLHRSLLRACRKQRIDFRADGLVEAEVPPQIMRGILVRMSKVTKRRGKLAAVVLCCVLVSGLFISNHLYSAYVEEHADGTIYTAQSGISTVSNHYYGGSFTQNPKALIGIYPLADETMMIMISENGSYKCEIWSKGKSTLSFTVPAGLNFVGGSKADGIAVFSDGHTLIGYDMDGQEIRRVPGGYARESSPKGRYITFTASGGAEVAYDVITGEEILRTDGEILHLTDSGLVFFEDSEGGNLPSGVVGNEAVIQTAVNNAGQFFTVERDGRAAAYLGDDLIWEEMLDIQPEDEEVKILAADILPGADIVSYVISVDGGIVIQAASVEDGAQLLDPAETDHTGARVPAPVLSSDGKYLLAAAQINEWRYTVRYLAAINLYRSPMRELRVPTSNGLTFWEIETAENGYYIYSYDSRRYLRVAFIENN